MPTPDICELILEQHTEFRRRFAELDDLRAADAETLDGVWQPLAALLEAHAAAEENSEHTAEEERGALADFRRNASEQLGREIGTAWLTWHGAHTPRHDRDDKGLVDYVEEHGDGEQAEQAEGMVD